MKKKINLNLILFFLFLTVFIIHQTVNVKAEETLENELKIAQVQTGKTKTQNLITIPINSPMELDFKTKSQVYAIRSRYVMKHRNLIDGYYKPSTEVFGGIEDKKAWWGIDGMSYKGSGKESINGPSEESRFICNPFLLAGLVRSYIFKSKRKPRESYPRPISLAWSADKKYGQVVYAMKRFFHGNPMDSPQRKHFTLVAYNARDLGYKYMYIDLRRSPNISIKTGAPKILAIPQFIHTGGSCGYPGGCNNMSPHCDDLEIVVKRLPAKICCKFWKTKPPSQYTPANIEFMVIMK